MARYRKVDPRIWNDAKFRALGDEGKLLFFALLTHPHLTALGAMRATTGGLAEELGWKASVFREVFDQVLANGMVEYDPVACYLALPRFLRYNAPESPNVVKAWINSLDLLPECALRDLTLKRASAMASQIGKGFREALPEVFHQAMQEGLPEGLPEDLA